MSRIDKAPVESNVATTPDTDATLEMLGIIGLGVVVAIAAAGLYWYFAKGGRHWF